MGKLIEKIYDNVVCTENEYAVSSRQFDEKVEKIIDPLNSKMSTEELEEIRALIYKAAYYAHKDGFVLGFKASQQLMEEVR